MTLHQGDVFSKEDCLDVHKSITKKFGFIIGALSLLCIFIGWNTYSANYAREKADDAAYESSVFSARSDEYRLYMKQDMQSVKASIEKLSDKQDTMNDSVQRLITKVENDK